MTNRRRIVYVTDGVSPSVIGGMQSTSRKHISWLAEADHELVVVYSRSVGRGKLDLPGEHIFVPWPKRRGSNVFNPARYVNELRAYSAVVAETIERTRPDVVYSEGPLLERYLRQSAAQRCPVIFHAHGLEMYQDWGSLLANLKSLPLRPLVRYHALNADVVLSQGGRLTEILVKRIGVDPSRIRLLSNCHLPSETLTVERKHDRKQHFLFVGRDESRKGLSNLLCAFERYNTDATLSVVGTSAPRRLAARNVSFHGEIRDRAAMMQFYADADFLVLPSLAEGMPTVICEAFSEGLPVIASDAGAVPIAVKHGKTGFLVPPGEVESLADAIGQALAMPQHEYVAMCEACLAQADDVLSPTRVRETLLRIIDEC